MDLQDRKYGMLINPDIKINRKYFEEMVKLLGIYVIHRAPKPGRDYTIYTEIDTNYENPETIGCIFEEHPDQKTLKKVGWVSELQEDSSMIHVAYDTKNIQRGSLIIVPSGLDSATGRLFKVNKLSNIMVYPASIAVEIVPEYESNYYNPKTNYERTSLPLLAQEEDDI